MKTVGGGGGGLECEGNWGSKECNRRACRLGKMRGFCAQKLRLRVANFRNPCKKSCEIALQNLTMSYWTSLLQKTSTTLQKKTQENEIGAINKD